MFFRRFLLLAKKFSFCRENWTQFNSSSMVQDFPDLFYFPTILSLSFFQNSWDSSYVPVQYWISSFVSLAVKEKFAIPLKSIEILWPWLSENFHFRFMFLTKLIFKTSHLLSGIYKFYLSENIILDQIWKILNTKFSPMWKGWKSSYEERQIPAFFCKLVFLQFISKLY